MDKTYIAFHILSILLFKMSITGIILLRCLAQLLLARLNEGEEQGT